MTPREFYKEQRPRRLEGLPGSCQQWGRMFPSFQPAPATSQHRFCHRPVTENAVRRHCPNLYATQTLRVVPACCWLHKRLRRVGHFPAPSSTPAVRKVIPSCEANAAEPSSLNRPALNQPISQPDASIICCHISLEVFLHGWSSQRN